MYTMCSANDHYPHKHVLMHLHCLTTYSMLKFIWSNNAREPHKTNYLCLCAFRRKRKTGILFGAQHSTMNENVQEPNERKMELNNNTWGDSSVNSKPRSIIFFFASFSSSFFLFSFVSFESGKNTSVWSGSS